MITLKQRIDKQYLGYAREVVYATNSMLGRHTHEKQFVIFGRGRSGSRLLVDLLNSNKDIYCDTEILNRPVFSPFSHIRNCSRMHASRVYGFKLLSYQLRSVQKTENPGDFVKKLVYDYGYQLIYISRKNLLRQTLSKHYANFRNSWHEKQKLISRPLMSVDIPTLLKHLEEGNQLYGYEQSIVESIDHLPLTYEDNLSSEEKQKDTIAQIVNFLDIEEFEANSQLQKITVNHFADFIKNYEEMAAALRSTPYAGYLEW